MKAGPGHSTHAARRGNVLLVTLVVIGVTSVGLVSYLSLMQSRAKLSGRAQSWNLSVPVAEAGIEEAMAHLIFSAGNNLASNGWALTATNGYRKQVTIEPGYAYYVATISTTSPPIIQTEGFVRNPGTTRFISRKLEVVTTNLANWKGLVVLQGITMEDDCWADSYDSSNPLYSSNGIYKAALAKQQGFVGTASKSLNAADISGKILGDFGTGANGVLKLTGGGVVGDMTFVSNPANANNYQAGHLNTAFNPPVPPVTAPFTNGYFTPGAGTHMGTNYTYVFTGGKYFTTTIAGPAMKIMVTADTTLYVGDTFHMLSDGLLAILPDVKLKLYVGKRFRLTGTSLVNPSGKPEQFAYHGLPTNLYFQLEDDSVLVGTAHAPDAEAIFEDKTDFSGAGLFLKASIHDEFQFHFDESLGGGNGRVIQIVSWSEL